LAGTHQTPERSSRLRIAVAWTRKGGLAIGPYMALSWAGRWPFPDRPGWFWEGLAASESAAIA